MVLISHRGNLKGRNPEQENTAPYIMAAINAGYDVEIDVWKTPDGLFLGHDRPETKTDVNFLENENLWIHCKNIEALEDISSRGFHCFFHQNDDVILTSKGFLWVFPAKPMVPSAICVLPELLVKKPICAGFCSDYIEDYK